MVQILESSGSPVDWYLVHLEIDKTHQTINILSGSAILRQIKHRVDFFAEILLCAKLGIFPPLGVTWLVDDTTDTTAHRLACPLVFSI